MAFNYALFTFLVAPLLDWLFGNGGAERDTDFFILYWLLRQCSRGVLGHRRRASGGPDCAPCGVPARVASRREVPGFRGDVDASPIRKRRARGMHVLDIILYYSLIYF